MKKMRWALGTIGVVIIISAFLSVRTSGSFTGSPVSSGVCTELVSDGGFEAGGQGWSQYSKLGFQLVSSFYRHSGRLGAWLGAANNAYDRLTQPLVLPTQADSITLSLWWALATEEGPGGAFDFLQVGLYAPDGTTKIASLLDVNNDSAEQWVWNLLNADLTAYAGQSVQLRIEATTDDNNPTSFFVDDVSVLSCVAATVTATPTVTAIATATPTVTAIATPTLTRLSPTSTPSITRLSPTSTPSITPTLTRTATPVTPASSTTPTGTSTATPTPTRTSTPQDQVTSTPTETRTPGIMDRRVYLPVLLRML